jgi:hypothetical protein
MVAVDESVGPEPSEAALCSSEGACSAVFPESVLSSSDSLVSRALSRMATPGPVEIVALLNLVCS